MSFQLFFFFFAVRAALLEKKNPVLPLRKGSAAAYQNIPRGHHRCSPGPHRRAPHTAPTGKLSGRAPAARDPSASPSQLLLCAAFPAPTQSGGCQAPAGAPSLATPPALGRHLPPPRGTPAQVPPASLFPSPPSPCPHRQPPTAATSLRRPRPALPRGALTSARPGRWERGGAERSGAGRLPARADSASLSPRRRYPLARSLPPSASLFPSTGGCGLRAPRGAGSPPSSSSSGRVQGPGPQRLRSLPPTAGGSPGPSSSARSTARPPPRTAPAPALPFLPLPLPGSRGRSSPGSPSRSGSAAASSARPHPSFPYLPPQEGPARSGTGGASQISRPREPGESAQRNGE